MRKVVFLTLLAVIAMPAHAQAWGVEGHQIIAHIAARELTPAARAQMRVLLGDDAETAMVEASTWADEIRDQRRETTAWHFVNIPIGSRGYDPQRDCRSDNCVVAQIERERRIIADRSLLAPIRAEALRFLIHFVGDVHQPLHASDNRDRGGNGFRVVIGRRQTNMHSVWDADVVRDLGRSPAAVAAALEADMSVAKRQTWQSGTAATWANESFQTASREIYLQPGPTDGGPPTVLPRDYAAREGGIVQEQLGKAGVRLAMILNAALR